MTPEQHNKYLAYSHIAYAALFALFAMLMLIFIWGMVAVAPNGPPAGILILMSLFMIVIYSVMILPSFIAGWALLKRKKWARTASIVAAVTDGMSFPFGTALCIYTLWFIFSDQGRLLYDNMVPASALPPAPPPWASAGKKQGEIEYIPPVAPPDWR